MDAARPTVAPATRAGRFRRGTRRALTVGVLVPAVALVVATPALADVSAVSGSAAGLQVNLSGLINANVGPAPTSSIPASGGTDTDNLLSLAVPGTAGVGALTTTSTGSTGAGGTVSSSADVANVNLTTAPVATLSLVRADTVHSQCTSNESGSSGSSTIENLRILGQTVTVTGAPNQVVPLTLNLPLLGNVGVTAHINEQIAAGAAPSSSITVNALRLEVSGVVVSGSVVIAQSVCGVTGDGTAVPAGAIGGVLLTGLVAIAFVGYQVSRRRRGPGIVPA